MKRLLCLATLALTAFGCADSEPVPGDVVVFDESTTADHRWKGLGTCSALGASINFGIGASEEFYGSWTYRTCEMFADFTNQVALFFNQSEPGATSADILANQTRKAALFNLLTRRIDDRLIMVASGGNDLLDLLDPVLDEATGIPLFVGADGAIYTPVVDPATGAISFFNTASQEIVASVIDPATGIPVPAVPGVSVLVNGAPCFAGDQNLFQTQCLPLLAGLFAEYEANLRETLRRVSLFSNGATILFRTEYNAFDEANCLTGAYSIGVDNSDPANAFLSGEQIAGFITPVFPTPEGPFQSLADLLLEGNGFLQVEGLNGVARRVASEFDVTVVDPFPVFKAAAVAGDNFVTQDCIHPTDAGHQALADLAFDAYLEANGF